MGFDCAVGCGDGGVGEFVLYCDVLYFIFLFLSLLLEEEKRMEQRGESAEN
jgi:hypothetical protein